MTGSNSERLSAIVEAHGVAFELSAAPPADITAQNFQKCVERLARMTMAMSGDEVETLRDELLIVDSAGTGVRLDRLAEHYPLSVSAAVAAETASDSSKVRIRAFDPVLDPKRSEH